MQIKSESIPTFFAYISGGRFLLKRGRGKMYVCYLFSLNSPGWREELTYLRTYNVHTDYFMAGERV